jgi:hypothetical protein
MNTTQLLESFLTEIKVRKGQTKGSTVCARKHAISFLYLERSEKGRFFIANVPLTLH